MDRSETPADPSPESRQLFEDFRARCERGESVDIDALCEDHPEHREELERLHTLWEAAGASELDVTRDMRPSDQVSVERAPADAWVAPASDGVERIVSQAQPRYEVRSEIGRGGMGRVLEVWDADMNRKLAMKVLSGKAVAQAGEARYGLARARFLEEAQVTAQLEHPGVVPVHEVGADANGELFFTMRRVKGDDLRKIFAKARANEGDWNLTRALWIMLKVCDTMAYAHAKGVVHRDLKPANVMVGPFGVVYVLDWGLALVKGREPTTVELRPREEKSVSLSAVATDRNLAREEGAESPLDTLDGTVLGTPSYMAPEQALGKHEELGVRSDVYSVGAMMYDLLSGQMPFVNPGARLSSRVVLALVIKGELEPLHKLASEAPMEVVAIVEKAMARAAEDRYSTMVEMADDLRAFLHHRVVRAYKTGALIEFRKWVSRNKALSISIMAAIVLGLVGLSGIAFVQARANERLERKNTEILRLADAQRLKQAEQSAATLWPATKDNIGPYQEWIADADRLLVGRSMHERTLAEMRRAALEWTPEEREHDQTTHPQSGELALLEQDLGISDSSLTRLTSREGTDRWNPATDEPQKERLIEAVDQLEKRVGRLREVVLARRTYTFANAEDQWQHDTLVELLEGLGRLDERPTGLRWDVQTRLEIALSVEESTLTSPEMVRAWEEAIASIADSAGNPHYGGLRIVPQLGLVPLGQDPVSELWEFAHFPTGTPPVRGADRRLGITEESGIVLVLVPGGTFTMGAVKPTATRGMGEPNVDDEALRREGPLDEVTLDPFFASKYEMTQAQWARANRHSNPSSYHPGYKLVKPVPTPLHPVEMVSWDECVELLSHYGLLLPTEAQWEYVARAGTSTRWPTGNERERLDGMINIADQEASRYAQWEEIDDWHELDDGWAVTAPVDALVPNAWGIHHMYGNVYEWCQDLQGGYELDVRPGDGLRMSSASRYRIYRGGSFRYTSTRARSSFRFYESPNKRENQLGLRPARALDG